jgi:hypothetical protein
VQHLSLSLSLSLWHSILRKEKREIMRKKTRKPREEVITTRSTNKTRGERKREREKRNVEKKALIRDRHSLSVLQSQVQWIGSIYIV